ncbi:hypothetical protein [Methanosarcina horonobensis]|uniref:hypothetical protein n=1 Tax=Methanosarcina horonobensis TaxID=418008 RepID=UPI000AAB10EF|nr:hypothetical protein [Methanosarcina horonobensis]
MEEIHPETSDPSVEFHPKADMTPGYGTEETRQKRKKPGHCSVIISNNSRARPGLCRRPV